MNKNKQAFSMVELIIAVSILIILSAVAVTAMESSKDKSNNSKILSDVETLNNAFKSYSEDAKDLPQPKGNLQYYGEDTGYRHDYETAFGVSGYITNDVLPAKYINNLPLDPKTGQFYGYARTKNTLNFEIAGVMFEKNVPKAKVSGNWTGEFGPYNLVKEYAGPNFVYDNATDFFPYNPYEKMLVAKVSSYTGAVLRINGRTYTDKEILEFNLGEGDTIEIGIGGTVNLYFSDGSNSVLGDSASVSKVTLENMKFVEDNNLYTSIKLALNMGSLWTKASKMSDKSEFEVYTSDAVAAVRGTIFGLQKGSINSDIVVQEGKVQIKEKSIYGEVPVNDTALVGAGIVQYNYMEGKSYIEVVSGSGAKGVLVNTGSNNTSGTGALGNLTPEGSGIIIANIAELNQNQQIELEKLNQTSSTSFQINLILQKSFKKAQYLKATNGTSNTYYLYNTGGIGVGNLSWSNSGTLNLINSTRFLLGRTGTGLLSIVNSSPDKKLSFSFCAMKNEKERCSKEISLIVKDNLIYDIATKKMTACESDIDEIYQKLFAKPITRPVCNTLLGMNGWGQKTKEQKENIIKNFMNDNNCFIYQKNNGVLDGTGFLNCKSAKVKIGTEKVVNGLAGKGYNLVAYAPYDNDSVDMKDYLQNNFTVWTGALLDSAAFVGLYNTGTHVFQDSPNLATLSSAGLSDLGFSVMREPTYAIYTWGSYGKGIFIDNKNADDFLKYNIASLNLTSTGYFAIEMSVRGAALKRTSGGPYTLFHLGNTYIKLISGTLYLDSGNTETLINIPQNLENNKFYKIVVEYTNGKFQSTIYDNQKILGLSGIKNRSIIMNNHMYVGNHYNGFGYDYQWNDIIDYVKIYKKPTITLTQLRTVVGEPTLTTESANVTFGSVALEAQ